MIFPNIKVQPYWLKTLEAAAAPVVLPEPGAWAAATGLLEFAKEWLSRQGGDDNYMTAKCRAAIAAAKENK